MNVADQCIAVAQRAFTCAFSCGVRAELYGGFMGTVPTTAAMELGFARVAVVSPELRVADVAYNVVCIVTALEELATEGTHLAVFPELCITGYSCADLFYQEALLRKSLQGLQDIA